MSGAGAKGARGQLGECPWGFVPAGGLSPPWVCPPSSRAVPGAECSDKEQPRLTAQAQPVLSQPCSGSGREEGLQPLSQTVATIPWTTLAVPQWEIRHREGPWGQGDAVAGWRPRFGVFWLCHRQSSIDPDTSPLPRIHLSARAGWGPLVIIREAHQDVESL